MDREKLGRQEIWEAVRNNVEVPLYLDGRLGSELLALHTVRPCSFEDVEQYEQTLFSDAEAAPLPCTGRAIIHPAVMLAGLMASQLTRWVRQEQYYRQLLFDLKTMTLLKHFPAY